MVYSRADADKPFMGLTSFTGELPAIKDIGIAKNYLSETECKCQYRNVGFLQNIVVGKPTFLFCNFYEIYSVYFFTQRSLMSVHFLLFNKLLHYLFHFII